VKDIGKTTADVVTGKKGVGQGFLALGKDAYGLESSLFGPVGKYLQDTALTMVKDQAVGLYKSGKDLGVGRKKGESLGDEIGRKVLDVGNIGLNVAAVAAAPFTGGASEEVAAGIEAAEGGVNALESVGTFAENEPELLDETEQMVEDPFEDLDDLPEEPEEDGFESFDEEDGFETADEDEDFFDTEDTPTLSGANLRMTAERAKPAIREALGKMGINRESLDTFESYRPSANREALDEIAQAPVKSAIKGAYKATTAAAPKVKEAAQYANRVVEESLQEMGVPYWKRQMIKAGIVERATGAVSSSARLAGKVLGGTGAVGFGAYEINNQNKENKLLQQMKKNHTSWLPPQHPKKIKELKKASRAR